MYEFSVKFLSPEIQTYMIDVVGQGYLSRISLENDEEKSDEIADELISFYFTLILFISPRFKWENWKIMRDIVKYIKFMMLQLGDKTGGKISLWERVVATKEGIFWEILGSEEMTVKRWMSWVTIFDLVLQVELSENFLDSESDEVRAQYFHCLFTPEVVDSLSLFILQNWKNSGVLQLFSEWVKISGIFSLLLANLWKQIGNN
jgi:hypothetical protein